MKDSKTKNRYPPTSAPPKLPPPGGDVPPYMLKEHFQGEKHVPYQVEEVLDRADYEDYEDYDNHEEKIPKPPLLKFHQGQLRPGKFKLVCHYQKIAFLTGKNCV